MSCCDEVGCRRSQPVLIRRGPFSGEWLAITRYRQDGDLITAQEKHTLPGVSQAEIEMNGSVLRDLHAHVTAQYEAEDNVNAERAYRDVLDKLAALAKAKETALIPPDPRAGGDDTEEGDQ